MINVLSLFDGMSCGQIALNRAEIPYKSYFASEIDKYAIKVTQKNFPNTIQLGSVNDYQHWDLPKIDLLLAGSPCQGFSKAGRGLNYNDPRSALIFKFLEIKAILKPTYWLLENVNMKKEWAQTLTELVGVEPVLINSSLVSAQNRQRLYWANFPTTQPEDRNIYLKDIIEDGEVDRDKSYTIDANYFKGGSEKYLQKTYYGKAKRQVVKYQSAKRLMIRVGSIRGRRTDENGIRHDYSDLPAVQRLEVRSDEKSGALTTVQKDNVLVLDDVHYRKLSVLECERLQTVPEGYTEGVSNTQRYKMLGNGWTVDVVAHILKGINHEHRREVC